MKRLQLTWNQILRASKEITAFKPPTIDPYSNYRNNLIKPREKDLFINELKNFRYIQNLLKTVFIRKIILPQKLKF